MGFLQADTEHRAIKELRQVEALLVEPAQSDGSPSLKKSEVKKKHKIYC